MDSEAEGRRETAALDPIQTSPTTPLSMSTESRSFSGRPVLRLEDRALLRGAGRFVDDLELPGLLHAAFVRSPVAHARLRSVNAAKARALPGVQAVLSYADLRPLLAHDRIPLALPIAAIRFHVDPYPLAAREPSYAGEPIAMVVAESRGLAEDAAGLIELDLEPLPAVLDARAALAPDAPKARLDCPDNLVAHWVVSYGDVEGAFAGAARRFSQRFRLHKGGGHSMEPRGVVARFDRAENLLTVWDSTQMPHRAKRVLVEALGLAEHQIRVIAPDVGGGFGPKNPFYPEELAVPAAALLLQRPIKWIEDRRESFTAPITSACRTGTWRWRSLRTAGSAPSAATFVTTTALRHLPGFRCRRTRSPISSAPMCCRRCDSRSPAASPTWWRRPRPAAPAARKAPS
jgi:carbon-monoxide dehydrogenase large subunit